MQQAKESGHDAVPQVSIHQTWSFGIRPEHMEIHGPIIHTHDGSMVLLYMVLHGSHQYTPFMLAYIPYMDL